MKKLSIMFSAILVVMSMLSSCGDDDPGFVEVNVLEEVYTDATEYESRNGFPRYNSGTNSYWEMGVQFTPSTSGEITHLGAFINSNDEVRVSLFNSKDESLITNITFNADSAEWAYEALSTPIQFTADDTLIVSVLSNDYQIYDTKDGTNEFPAIHEYMTLISYVEEGKGSNTTDNSIPPLRNYDYVGGLPAIRIKVSE